MSTETPTTSQAPTDTRQQSGPGLHDQPVSVRTKLSAAWAAFMFFYIYVDYLHLYKPGVVDDIRAGVVFEFDISQTFVVSSLALVGIPALMIVLSTALPARASRVLNLVVATLYVPVSAFNIVGESWFAFYGLGIVVEVALLAFVLRCAWAWPRTTTPVAP